MNRLMKMESPIAIAQMLNQKPVHHISELYGPAGSRATAYRVMQKLQTLGFAETKGRGYYTIRNSVFQPYRVQLHLHPSLQAIGQARYFGKSYNESDIHQASEILSGQVTLDYRAYDITHFQTPFRYFIYVANPNQSANELIMRGFSEGTKGRVAVMPIEGGFENEIQRLYLDCLAFGGRSTLDAIAIELLYCDKLKVKGEFPAELVAKVREELPTVEP